VKARGGDSYFVLREKLKWLAVCMASAEMLNCKLLSTPAAGIKLCTLHHVMEIINCQHGRTLARTLCSGKEPNAIARRLISAT